MATPILDTEAQGHTHGNLNGPPNPQTPLGAPVISISAA